MTDTLKNVKVKINVDNKDSTRAFKQSESNMASLTKSTKSLAMGFIGLGAVLAGMTKSVKLAIDAEETHSKLHAVFSNQTSNVTAVIKDLTDNYILSTAGAEKMVAATGDLLTGFGFTQKSALGLAEKVAKLGADLASFTNFSGGAEGAAEALTAAMLGETERAKALGIVIRQNSKEFKELVRVGTEVRDETLLQAKAMAVLTIATIQSKNAIGDVASTRESTANVLKQLSADVENLAIAFGKNLLPIIKSIANALIILTKNFDLLSESIIRERNAIMKSNIENKKWDDINKSLTASQRKRLAEISKAVEKRYDDETQGIFEAQRALQLKGKWDKANALASTLAGRETAKTNTVMSVTYAKLAKEINFVKKETIDFVGVTDDMTGKQREAKKVQEGINAVLNKTPTLQEKVAAGVKKIQKARKDAITAQEKAIKLAEKERRGILKTVPIIGDHTEALQEWADKGLIPGIKSSKVLAKKLNDLAVINIIATNALEKMSNTIETVSIVLGGLTNVFDKLGKESLANLTDGLREFTDLAGNIAAGNVTGALTQAFGMIANSIEKSDAAFKSMIENFNVIENISENISGVTGLDIGFTQEMLEQLEALTEKYGNAEVAYSLMIGQMIDGNVTLENSDKWLEKIGDALKGVDSGTLSVSDAVKSMGQNFQLWLEQAKELGTTGSQIFFDFVSDLKNSGIEVKEITDFINESWDNAVDGWRKFKEETGSTISLPVLDELIAKQDELAKDKYQPALNGLLALNEALLNMSNVVKLTDEEFDSFEAGARSTFETLISQGLDSATALEKMAPVLSRLIFLQNEHGLVIDEATQAIIDQARENGINLDIQKSVGEQALDIQRQQLELFKAIAKALGVNVDAMESFGDAAVESFGDAETSLESFGNSLGGLDFPNIGEFGGGSIPGFAGGTNGFIDPPKSFIVGEKGPELMQTKNGQMNITPNNQVTNTFGTVQAVFPGVTNQTSALELANIIRSDGRVQNAISDSVSMRR